MRLLSEDACRPFSADRRGLVLSEGAALLVLEKRLTPSRVARRYWRVCVDGASAAMPVTRQAPPATESSRHDGRAGRRRISQQMKSVRSAPTAPARLANDAAEARAIAALLGRSSRRGARQRDKGRSATPKAQPGAFAALAAVLSMQHETLPPLAGYLAPDASLPPCASPPTGTERFEASNVLVNASGFGGANVSLVFEKAERRLSQTAHGGASHPPRGCHGHYSDVPTRRRLATPDEPRLLARGSSLRLDRISSLVMSAAEDCPWT